MESQRPTIRRLALAGTLASLSLVMAGCGGGETVSSSRTATSVVATTVPNEVAMTDGTSTEEPTASDAEAANRATIDEKSAAEQAAGQKGAVDAGPIGGEPSTDQGASNDDGPPEDDADRPGGVAAGDSLPGGRSLVFVHEILADEGALVVDLAQYFEGPAADQAARADGAIGPRDQIDGGRYVRNANSRLRTVPVRAGTVDLMDLASTMSATPEANAYFVSVAGGWITGVSPADLSTS